MKVPHLPVSRAHQRLCCRHGWLAAVLSSSGLRVFELRHGLILGAAFVGAALAALPAHAQKSQTSKAGGVETRQLELMARSIRIAREWHVGRPSKRALIAGAVDGLLAKIGPEAEYYSRTELRRLSRATASGDVGLEVKRAEAPRRGARPGHYVVSSRDGSPAALAGLKAGDLITKIDGRDAGGIPHLVVARSLLGGVPGISVAVEVQRRGFDGPHVVQLERVRERGALLESVEVEAGVLWLRIAALEAPVAEMVAQRVVEARQRLGAGLRGIVVDLRDVTGGDMEAAGDVARLFAPKGGLFMVERRKGREPIKGRAQDSNFETDLVVMIDGGTAGLAEALASTLKAARSARIVGGKSAGRGEIFTLEPVGRRGAKGSVRIPTQRLLTPDGKAIHNAGLTPDVPFAQSPSDLMCRETDITVDKQPGQCRRRSLGEDAQLRAAVGLIGEILASRGIAKAPAAAGNSDSPVSRTQK